jgi:hypothetical protein
MEDIKVLRERQEKNKIIRENKDVFFAVCNKMLDFLYSGSSEGLSSEVKETVTGLIKSMEMARKKIKNDAELDESEIVHIILASQYTAASMEQRSKDLAKAHKELFELIKNLTS